MPKHTTAVLLAVILLFCAVVLAGRSKVVQVEDPEPDAVSSGIEEYPRSTPPTRIFPK